MQKLPAIDSQDLLRFLKGLGFVVIRTKGSHVRLRSEDGRLTVVPIHETHIVGWCPERQSYFGHRSPNKTT
ncbi:MAG: type II toxin-antitoxin system HicA family toxin [Methanothrix sp.]